jgi:hypothetical protein
VVGLKKNTKITGTADCVKNHFASFHPPTYDQISVVFRDKGHQLSCYFSYVSFMAAELVIWGVVTQSDGSPDLPISPIYSEYQVQTGLLPVLLHGEQISRIAGMRLANT